MYLLTHVFTFQKTYDIFVTMRQFQMFERYDIRNISIYIDINIYRYNNKILKKKYYNK